MPMVTVSLSPQQAEGIRQAVDEGGYASSSQVVREALQMWSANRKGRVDKKLGKEGRRRGHAMASDFVTENASR
ncbi:ribbon-helix-helix domain-containing protein [Oryzifoliimicrobium ureilyticus]|uniref:ribbon-helix-helix domain-containing protein n=1 Tax=Oryzifoliimicrobium ureilyticus TaxID=3113724 RepID=UPI003075F3A7